MLHTNAGAGDRAEFLREAESMLEFDHPNLVRLVGVAVQQRPWLCVLEFMRFGKEAFHPILHSFNSTLKERKKERMKEKELRTQKRRKRKI